MILLCCAQFQTQTGGGGAFAGGLAGGMVGGAMMSSAANSGSRGSDCQGYREQVRDLKEENRRLKRKIRKLNEQLKKAGIKDRDYSDSDDDDGYDSGDE